jgi:hypothetical protein
VSAANFGEHTNPAADEIRVWGALARSFRRVNYVASWRYPEIDPARIVSPFFLRHAEVIAPAPRDRMQKISAPAESTQLTRKCHDFLAWPWTRLL